MIHWPICFSVSKISRLGVEGKSFSVSSNIHGHALQIQETALLQPVTHFPIANIALFF